MRLSIKEVLTRQVEEILPEREGLARAMQKKITVYLGVDPTSTNLHLGHAISLRKLQQLQELGHKAILLFGTFTAQIGDPTGRDQQRKPLSQKDVEENMKSYRKQAGKVLDLSKVEVRENGEWLSKLKFKDILGLAANFTVSQLLERDMFQKRIANKEEVWLHEFMYPLMQGYDSVAMNVDLEIGGTDQTFNMLVGRKLQKIYNSKEKFVLTTPLLLGLDGRKMSKTFGNTVNIEDEPKEMFGKLMSLKDELILHYFELCTDVATKEIKEIEEEIKRNSSSARDAKARLAQEIVTIYHGKKAGLEAEKEFEKIFKEGQLPSTMPEVSLKGVMLLVDVLVQGNLAASKAEARRLIQQGGVRVNREIVKDEKAIVDLSFGMVIQVGKRKFVKIS